jgi:hypothetical protein
MAPVDLESSAERTSDTSLVLGASAVQALKKPETTNTVHDLLLAMCLI